MTEIFDRARPVTAFQVAQDAGLPLRQRGEKWWGCCPLHHERTPSFAVYADGSWACFGCGAAGADGTSLYAAIHNLSQVEAARALVGQHSLPTGPARPSARSVLRDVKRWKEDEFKRLYGLLGVCRDQMEAGMRGVPPDADFPPEFVKAARTQTEIYALIDQLERSTGVEAYQMTREEMPDGVR